MMDRGGGLGKKLLRDGGEETRIRTLFPAYSHPLLISTLSQHSQLLNFALQAKRERKKRSKAEFLARLKAPEIKCGQGKGSEL